MTTIPKEEVRAIGVLNPFTKILEFGNKKNLTGLYKNWYEAKAKYVTYISTDINGLDGAIQWDVTKSIPESILSKGPFDLVTNFGFSEHVQTDKGQETFWKHAHELVAMHGKLAIVLPRPGFWKDHGKKVGWPGIYYPYESFYTNFAEANGYIIEDMWTSGDYELTGGAPPNCNCVRMRKTEIKQFTMVEGLHKNIV